MMDRGVTAAIPTLGRPETLPMVLTALGFQTHPVEELILLDEADTTVMENFAVSQALDYLSLKGVEIKIIRNRRRKGIGAARLRIAEEASNPSVLMVDDDVVLEPDCLKIMIDRTGFEKYPWVVPTCILVPKIGMDGYIDHLVDYDDPRVRLWTSKYPWFYPYFRFNQSLVEKIPCSGTQAILVHRETFLEKCSSMRKLGTLPREDTYMTSKMGVGLFVSEAVCSHFSHPGQAGRDNWSASMFYRLHEAARDDPDGFLKMLGKEE